MKAIITGITGQDGSYLAEFLLSKNYEVHGIYRRSSNNNCFNNIEHILDRITLHCSDLCDSLSILSIIKQVEPDEIYNLAAQSHVSHSFTGPSECLRTNGEGFLNILESVRILGFKNTKIYQASTSELFGNGNNKNESYNEQSKFSPESPYACSKMYAHNLAQMYKKSYGMFISCGILFNHESPRRGSNFVTKKIIDIIKTQSAHKFENCPQLKLGSISPKRDWGYAKEYVEAMWLMLQQDLPDDFVISTGETYSILEFLTEVYRYFGCDIYIKDNFIFNKENNFKLGVTNYNKYIRSNDVEYLCGDSTKANTILGWINKSKLSDLIKYIIEGDKND